MMESLKEFLQHHEKIIKEIPKQKIPEGILGKPLRKKTNEGVLEETNEGVSKEIPDGTREYPCWDGRIPRRNPGENLERISKWNTGKYP